MNEIIIIIMESKLINVKQRWIMWSFSTINGSKDNKHG